MLTRAVSFTAVTKQYSRGPIASASLRDTVSAVLSGIRHPRAHLEPFRALDSVSFDVAQGDSFAIIGPNGAGKTTALKLMTRVTPPTSGEIRVRGRVGALIEVGAGVHPELTGRENIWLYGRLLGMTRNEIRRRFDEIVEFSELSDVLDTVTKRYSSGMQLRLGFSIAAHIDPEIFVVDEALSVGDAVFQSRCIERMTQFVSEGRTLIFVSHNLTDIETLCSRAIFLRNGLVVSAGDARDVLSEYLDWVEGKRASEHPPAPSRGALEVLGVTLHDLEGRERMTFGPRDGMEIRIRFRGPRLQSPYVNLGITDGRPGYLAHLSMLVDGDAPAEVGPGEWVVSCRINALRLRSRLYEIWGNVFGADGTSHLTEWLRLASFRIEEPLAPGPLGLLGPRTSGAIDLDYTWSVDAIPPRPDPAPLPGGAE